MDETINSEVGSPDMKHHRVVVTRHGGPKVLEVVEEDIPEPRRLYSLGLPLISVNFCEYGVNKESY
jgi:hypothetical protein